MIIRVYRCTVVAGKDAEFREFAFSKGHPWLTRAAGPNRLLRRKAASREWRAHPLHGSDLGKRIRNPSRYRRRLAPAAQIACGGPGVHRVSQRRAL
jgi:hypothetical protein